MDAHLIIVGGNASKDKIELKLPMIIGRSKEANLTIGHPMVSRRHCELYEADGLIMIRDNESLNGTHVGKQRIKESPLPPNAEFKVGPLTFQVKYQYKGNLKKLPAPILADKTPKTMVDASVEDEAKEDGVIDFDEMDLSNEDPAADDMELIFEDAVEEPKSPAAPVATPVEKSSVQTEPPAADADEPPEEAEGEPKKKEKRSWLGGLLGKKKTKKPSDEKASDEKPEGKAATTSEAVTVPVDSKAEPVQNASVVSKPNVEKPAAATSSAKPKDNEDIDFLAVPDEDSESAAGPDSESGDPDDAFDEFLKDF